MQAYMQWSVSEHLRDPDNDSDRERETETEIEIDERRSDRVLVLVWCGQERLR